MILPTIIAGLALLIVTFCVLALVPRRPRQSLWRDVRVPQRPAVTMTATVQRASWPHLPPARTVLTGTVIERKEIGP